MPVNLEFVQKYVALSKGVNPTVSEEAKLYIAKQHAQKRKSETDEHLRSHRLVPALQRLALATARFDFAEVVTLDHVKFAEGICAKSLNETDPGLLTGNIDKQSRQQNQRIETLVRGLFDSLETHEKNTPITSNGIESHLKEHGIVFDKKGDVNEAIRNLGFLQSTKSGWLKMEEELI